MEKQEILNHLLEKALEITAYLEEHCDYEQLYEDGLYAMLYIRYQNALSLLREDRPGYGRPPSAGIPRTSLFRRS